jgi:hypothetical protein
VGERFPDTEEATSSNLVPPTAKVQVTGQFPDSGTGLLDHLSSVCHQDSPGSGDKNQSLATANGAAVWRAGGPVLLPDAAPLGLSLQSGLPGSRRTAAAWAACCCATSQITYSGCQRRQADEQAVLSRRRTSTPASSRRAKKRCSELAAAAAAQTSRRSVTRGGLVQPRRTVCSVSGRVARRAAVRTAGPVARSPSRCSASPHASRTR